LKPIETKNLTASDVDALTYDTRELMLKELVSLTAKARGEPIAMPAQSSGEAVVKASGISVNGK
jgi:lysophosphatidate acyltransferase